MFCRCVCLFNRAGGLIRSFNNAPVAGYKSQYSIDKLYPNSNINFARNASDKYDNIQSDNFTGHIPIDELDIRYSRSSGPGGQHVNKVNTKVDIRFHVASASWLPQWIRDNILLKERTKISKDGYLIVTSEKTRKQMLNQADCLDKIRTIVWNSAEKPYEPSPEELQLMDQRKETARKKILREKKAHSLKKQLRQDPSSTSI